MNDGIIEYRLNGWVNSVPHDKIDRIVRDGMPGAEQTSKTPDDPANGKTDLITLENGEVIGCRMHKVETKLVLFRRTGE